VQHDGYSIRVESVRENRIEAVRIRERRAAASSLGRRARQGRLSDRRVCPLTGKPRRTSVASAISMVAKQNCVRNCTKAPNALPSRQPTGRFGG
jgi:hypothetical protein